MGVLKSPLINIDIHPTISSELETELHVCMYSNVIITDNAVAE